MPLKPPPTSCRAPGSVVHLMAANNTLLPVTLDITSHEDQDGPKNVVKVGNKRIGVQGLDSGRGCDLSCASWWTDSVRSCVDPEICCC